MGDRRTTPVRYLQSNIASTAEPTNTGTMFRFCSIDTTRSSANAIVRWLHGAGEKLLPPAKFLANASKPGKNHALIRNEQALASRPANASTSSSRADRFHGWLGSRSTNRHERQTTAA